MLPNHTLSRVNDLLSFARVLCHYEKSLEAATGERFNIFNILGVGHLEAQTHTPFIAELLDPTGSHGRGAIFLKLFVESLGLERFDFDAASVHQEVHLGEKTATSGGRLDILVKEGGTPRILIENKIYASEQDNQLGRYQAFAPNAELVYLTLDGSEPQKSKSENLRLVCVSYRVGVLAWLEICRKEAAITPNVREAITQYHQLILQLTHQNISARMNQEIIKKVLEDRETYAAYVAIRDSNMGVRKTLINKLNKELEGIALGLHMELISSLSDSGQKYCGLSFSHPLLRQHGINIRFEFDGGDYKGFFFGFCYSDQTKAQPNIQSLQNAFESQFGKPNQTAAWPAWLWYNDEHRNWTEKIFAEIQFGNLAEILGERLKLLMDVASQVLPGPADMANITPRP